MQQWSKLKTIVEEPEAEASIDRLSQEYPRFSDQWEGLKWLLARKPEEISRIRKVDNHVFHLAHRTGDKLFRTLEIAVVYKIEDSEVIVFDVNAWPPSDDDGDS